MIHPVAGIVFRQLRTVVVLILVLSAIYVVAGRLLLPLASGYGAELEQRLSLMTGMQVSVTGLEGELVGFNPVLRASRLTLTPVGTAGGQASLAVDDPELVLDVGRSLRERRMILSSARLRSPVVELHEQADGAWQLAGFSGNGDMTLDDAFALVTSLGNVELSDARVVFRFASGEERVFSNAGLRFRSQQGQHHLSLDALDADSGATVSVVADLGGDSLDVISGSVYMDLALQDWAPFVAPALASRLEVNALELETELWADFENGRPVQINGLIKSPLARAQSVGELATDVSVTLTEIHAALTVREKAGNWQAWLTGLRMTRGGTSWTDSDIYAAMSADGLMEVRASRLDAAVVSGVLRDLALLPHVGVDELVVLNPRGALTDLSLSGTWQSGQLLGLSVSSNLENVRVNARGAAPAIWGVYGYQELHLDLERGITRGFVEVDSDELMLHLPNLFDDIWDYNHVNGRVNYRVDTSDGLKLRVDSSVIVAESETISGRAQFATEYNTPPGESPVINFELMVGALKADIAYKSQYLPMAPNAPQSAQAVLDWVDAAVHSGRGDGSGFLFRGHVHRGALPQSRTVQMFYHVKDGVLAFDPEWPVLDSLDGHVVVDDQEVDVRVSDGQSLDIGFAATTAAVRANPDGDGRWLTVNGRGRGEAGHGLQYLASTPVTAGLGAYFADWETEGDVDFTLDLAIPFAVTGADPVINLRLGLDNNTIHIPDYGLDIADVQGALLFDAIGGLSSEALTATLFDWPVIVNIVTGAEGQQGTDTRVDVAGRMAVDDLTKWSMRPAILDPMLSDVGGEFVYSASLDLPQQQAGRQVYPMLSLRSTLEGVTSAFPAPLDKQEESQLPLDLRITFEEQAQDLRVRLGDLVSVNARINENGIDRGLVFLSPPADGVRVRRFDTSTPGLEVLGRVSRFDVQQWMTFLQSRSTGSGVWQLPAGTVSQLDVNIDEVLLMDEVIPAVNLQLRPATEHWLLSLSSDDIQGQVRLPYQAGEMLEASFERLHIGTLPDELPQGEVTVASEIEILFDELETVEYVMPRVDPFEHIDPRLFPPLQATIASLAVGGTDFGSWQFALSPQDSGVEFSDLRVNSRGLQIGSEESPGHFFWFYDGERHHSELSAEVRAGNLGEVLSAYGYAPSLESREALFDVDLNWRGSPGYFAAVGLNGDIDLRVRDGRFLRGTGAANNALKLISIINFDAVMRRLRFSDDLVRQGLAYDEIRGHVKLEEGIVSIQDRLQIIGPSSLFQVSGQIDLPNETIDGSLYVTLPVSENIPWLSGLAVLNNLINWQIAIGVFVLDRIFGEQVDNLTSAQYTLQGRWEELEPRLYQVFSGGG